MVTVIDRRPYAVLHLQEALSGSAPKSQLLLPVALACLLSARLQFVFPMGAEVSRSVDSIVDDYFEALILRSKGIHYAKNLSHDEITGLMAQTSLLVTTDQAMSEAASDSQLPYAFVARAVGQADLVKLGHVERLEDEELRRDLAGYAQLLNIQSSLFVSGSLCASPGPIGAVTD